MENWSKILKRKRLFTAAENVRNVRTEFDDNNTNNNSSRARPRRTVRMTINVYAEYARQIMSIGGYPGEFLGELIPPKNDYQIIQIFYS